MPGHSGTDNETANLMSLQPELNYWNKYEHQFLLQTLQKAHEEGRLSCGIKAVWNTATHRRGVLLVVEENLMSPGGQEGANAFTRPVADPYHTKDLVDDIIEKVLKGGGDVEFVEPGTLSHFQQIALIEFHQSQ